jgi:tRNA(Ile)-lysidine synthase
LWGAVKKQGNALELKRNTLSTLHKAMKRHLLRTCVKELTGNLKDIENRHIEDMLSLLDKPSGRQIDLPYGLIFAVGYESYWLGYKDDMPCPYPTLEGEYALTVPGISELPGWRVKATISRISKPVSIDNLTACFDVDRVGQRLGVRTWRRGDRFIPLGLEAAKKLGQFMIDAKIPRHWRSRIPLVVVDGQIAWLVGYRIGDEYKMTERTRRVLKLEFKLL